MFSHYAMSPNGSSCPPMEPTYSNSSEYSMQSSNMGYLNVYGMEETDFELCPQPSHPSSASSVYASSYPSSFSSSYTSSPFEPSYDVSPSMMCRTDVPQTLQAPFFSSPMQMENNWPVPATQAPSIDEPLFTPDTQFMMSDMTDMADTTKPAKPYVCPCGKAFTRPADLKRHETTVHNPVYKDCPVEECLRKAGNGFPRQDHLIEHLRSYHHWNVPKRRVIKRVAKSS